MISREQIVVGTDPVSGWRFHAIHKASSQILKLFFDVSYYKRSIHSAKGELNRTSHLIELIEKRGKSFPDKSGALARAEELDVWCQKMEEDEYHDLYVTAFVGVWSSFESGVENIVRDYLMNDKKVAEDVLSLFKKRQLEMEEWPWSPENSLDLAKKLDPKAKQLIQNGGILFSDRLVQVFDWIGISLSISEQDKAVLNEANRVRNIFLHQGGIVTKFDSEDFPALWDFEAEVIPMNRERFVSYYNAINSVFINLIQGRKKSI